AGRSGGSVQNGRRRIPPLRVPQLAAEQQDDINDPPHAEAAKRKELHERAGRISQIESVRTEYAADKREAERDPPVLIALRGLGPEKVLPCFAIRTVVAGTHDEAAA